MKKSDILSALERIPGDPEIEITLILKNEYGRPVRNRAGEIDRINEFPRPEIVVIEK